MQHLRSFMLSEGARYQQLTLAAPDLETRSAANAPADGLDGWTYLMRTPQRDFALVYFENQASGTRMRGFTPGARYRWNWFDPRTGKWSKPRELGADTTGILSAPPFPGGGVHAAQDVAAKIVRLP
jgi:hypothetical protein